MDVELLDRLSVRRGQQAAPLICETEPPRSGSLDASHPRRADGLGQHSGRPAPTLGGSTGVHALTVVRTRLDGFKPSRYVM